MMPIMSGPAVLQALAAQGRLASLPVVLMSAATEADVRAVVGDDVAFLRKPFDMPSLLRAIHTALGARARR
jgi:CheY-like chemotaxis protein